LYECLRHLTLSVAPVVPFVAEDIYQHSAELLGCDKRDFLVEPSVSSCVFDVLMPSANSQWSSTAISDCWNHVLDVHSKVNSIAEAARKDGAIGSCLEASVLIGIPNDHPAKAYLSHLDKHRDLSDVLSCSQVGIEPSAAVSPSDSFHEKGSGLFSYYTEAVVIGSDTPIKSVCLTAPLGRCGCLRI
jgi:isoleucyl-tRNA synthetase